MTLSIHLSICFATVAFASANGSDPQAKIKRIIDPIVAKMAKKYNCSISVALRGPDRPGKPFMVESAAGVIDRSSGRTAQISDQYVWGSVTKLVTGTGVLQLVDQGKVSLGDSVPQHIDPFLKKMAATDPTQNYTSLEELWGKEVYKITVKDLLGMRSGVPDFDTASPSGKEPSDFLRQDSYQHPNHSFSPTQLLNLPWVRTGKLQFTPGYCNRQKYFNCYSSANYVLLGLMLANHADVPDWRSYQQEDVLASVTSDFSKVQFATQGPPSKYTPVRGYDTTHYNHNTKAIDVSDVCGVFGGWTASDFVTDAHSAAALTQDVYGPDYRLVSKTLVDEMYAESNLTGYGLATFNLTHLTPYDVAYGHLGATYGFQSIVVFIPTINMSVAIASNIERDYQDQPQDVFCGVYNSAKAVLQGKPVPKCTFKPGYWNGGCKCHNAESDEVFI